MSAAPWMVSLHGGHSGTYCEHAEGDLEELLEAAVESGFHTFGVTEHAPRSQSRFVYSEEVDKGYDVDRLASDFEAYAQRVFALAEEFADRLVVLRGFEVEVVPNTGYVEEMLELRQRHQFDYMVGSVHYVDEISIDGKPRSFQRAVQAHGSIEELAVRYYGLVTEMVRSLRPEVVGHLDLIRKNAGSEAVLDSPPIRRAASEALAVVHDHGAILDLNTAGIRKGLGSPYPAPWLVRAASEQGIPFCFGDDSHRPSEVGAGIAEARDYLLANGVDTITHLAPSADGLEKKVVAL
ncbi:MAG: histidinol-phosphatase [Acidobacteriota bacterium]|nr:histidinol-phosphatase [Acidobacteriota bacterium]